MKRKKTERERVGVCMRERERERVDTAFKEAAMGTMKSRPKTANARQTEREKNDVDNPERTAMKAVHTNDAMNKIRLKRRSE